MDQRVVIGSYRAETDVSAIRRHAKKWLRKKGLQLTLAGAAMGLLSTFIFFVLYLAWGLFSRGTSPDMGFLLVGAVIVLSGVGLAWQYAFSRIDVACKASIKWTPAWQTTILESGIEVAHDNGIVLHVPWTLMKVLLETEEAWTIEYADTSIVLFKGPLRAAGLENEVRGRIGMTNP